MKPQTRLWMAALTAVILIGCATFETNAYRTIGVTGHTVDILMTTWADASVTTNSTPDLDARITAANSYYRQSMALAKVAIDGYRAGTNTQAAVNAALSAMTKNKENLRELILMLVLPQNQRTEIQKLP